jgi:hypothetical protein
MIAQVNTKMPTVQQEQSQQTGHWVFQNIRFQDPSWKGNPLAMEAIQTKPVRADCIKTQGSVGPPSSTKVGAKPLRFVERMRSAESESANIPYPSWYTGCVSVDDEGEIQ